MLILSLLFLFETPLITEGNSWLECFWPNIKHLPIFSLSGKFYLYFPFKYVRCCFILCNECSFKRNDIVPVDSIYYSFPQFKSFHFKLFQCFNTVVAYYSTSDRLPVHIIGEICVTTKPDKVRCLASIIMEVCHYCYLWP